MQISQIKKGDLLISDGVSARFEVLKVNRVTIRVRNSENGNILSAYPALFDRKVEDGAQ